MIKELTQKLLEKVIIEIKKTENISRLQSNIINPVVFYAYSKLYPYFLTVIILFVVILIISLMNLVILMKIFLSKNSK
jgi:hypothetical protein|tara:strand:+ start:443 stop:676 length:234 start_codon:yes stop_codon:yes gene_type:complete